MRHFDSTDGALSLFAAHDGVIFGAHSKCKPVVKPMEKLNITQVDCDIIGHVGKDRMKAADIATALDLKLTNTHKKLTTLCARGLMSDSYRADTTRTGLHAGEKRRLYTTTALGRSALALYNGVQKALERTGAEQKTGRRTTTSEKPASKRPKSASSARPSSR